MAEELWHSGTAEEVKQVEDSVTRSIFKWKKENTST